MSFEVKIAPSAARLLKKYKRPRREKIVQEAQKIPLNPYENEKLHPPLQECRSYHFNWQGITYRIAYKIYEEKRLIVVVLAAKHEGFYEQLRRITAR